MMKNQPLIKMNYLTSFKDHIEKNAGFIGSSIGLGLKHPYITLGGLAGLGALGAAIAVSNKVHPLHQIISEQQKKGIIRDQRDLLGQILAEQKKQTIIPIEEQKLIQNPLA